MRSQKKEMFCCVCEYVICIIDDDDKLLLFALQVGNSIDARLAEGHGGGSQRLFGSGYRCPEHRQAQGRTL